MKLNLDLIKFLTSTNYSRIWTPPLCFSGHYLNSRKEDRSGNTRTKNKPYPYPNVLVARLLSFSTVSFYKCINHEPYCIVPGRPKILIYMNIECWMKFYIVFRRSLMRRNLSKYELYFWLLLSSSITFTVTFVIYHQISQNMQLIG